MRQPQSNSPSSSSHSRWMLLPVIASLMCPGGEGRTFGIHSAHRPSILASHATTRFSSSRSFHPSGNAQSSPLLLDLRGGSTATAKEEEEEEEAPPPQTVDTSATDKYRMQQITLLQARSARLRQALMERGVLTDIVKANADGANEPQPVDWDCALSTKRHPKSCLYSLDAQQDTKVVSPAGTNDWIGLSALTRLRRDDPSKLEPLWHNKFAIQKAWFAPSSQYSLYAHLPWQGYLLTILLDVPLVLNAFVMAVILTTLYMTQPLWESFLAMFLTSGFLWKRWPSWMRYAHAALPLKLLMGQLAWKGAAICFGKVAKQVREYLIGVESQIWEAAIPVTVIEPGDEAIVEQTTGRSIASVETEEDEEGDSDDEGDEEDGQDEDDEEINLDDDDDDEEGSDFEMITTFGGVEKRTFF